MKKYLIDQVLFLILGVGIMVCIPFFCGPVFTLVFEVMSVLSWAYLCRRILLLLFDYLYGKVNCCAYFAAQCGFEDCEFYKAKYCSEWKFYYGNNQTLKLLVPIVASKEELCTMPQPKKDEKLKITYLHFSKILLDWEPF